VARERTYGMRILTPTSHDQGLVGAISLQAIHRFSHKTGLTLKALRKSALLAAAAAALTAGAVIAPAASASAAELKPAKSGMAVIDLNSSLRSTDGETHTKDVGGGSWTYGWELTTGGKRCFSHYFHGSKMHHATARIANAENKAYAFAKHTAKASATAGAAYTCYAYWSVDE
jgi:hypothetical protein